ncbi:VC0807 family protein [Sphingomonas sp. BIUV-7]|uniref:VC0807 family protein n=1 Tax=Sphingomonas natans TaxID=3063330 RepID=A0ABT8YAL8_9SPHN|nr:VC0807 family protein [Sphingomonas sp. BIUV-7]MDO6415032.1 VC0807 family protein [Sphingomonas sp. BIUV-7]
MAMAPHPTPARRLTSHVAASALAKSVAINMVAPAILYGRAAPHFPPNSVVPLAISGVPPLLWLAFSLARTRAVDFLGLFAAESVMVRMTALLIAQDERGALIGRAMENGLLAIGFLVSLMIARPLLFYMARQLATGNDPAQRAAFDNEAAKPHVRATYRELTIGWVVGLTVKSAINLVFASYLSTREFLMISPLWDLASDAILVTVSLLYGKARLSAARSPAAEPAIGLSS